MLAKLMRQERPHALTIRPDGEPGDKQSDDGVLFLRRRAHRRNVGTVKPRIKSAKMQS
jgi:hypothetical protein